MQTRAASHERAFREERQSRGNFPKRVVGVRVRPSYSPEPWPYWCRRRVPREQRHRFCSRTSAYWKHKTKTKAKIKTNVYKQMPPHKSWRPRREAVPPPATGQQVNRANSQLESAAITKNVPARYVQRVKMCCCPSVAYSKYFNIGAMEKEGG